MFTAFDGSIVAAGDLVASIKVAPHVVDEAAVAAGERIAARRPPADRPGRAVPAAAGRGRRQGGASGPWPGERFEASVRAKVERLGSEIVAIVYADDGRRRRGGARRRVSRGRGRVDVVLTAGGGSTDPLDPFFVAIDELGGRDRPARRAVASGLDGLAGRGSGRTAVLGLPTCGAYSKATAADLVLPRLLTGERPSPLLVSPLGHGGVLTRNQRFRFADYAKDLDAPDG